MHTTAIVSESVQECRWKSTADYIQQKNSQTRCALMVT